MTFKAGFLLGASILILTVPALLLKGNAVAPVPVAPKTESSPLQLTVEKFSSNERYYRVIGFVKNQSQKSFSFVRLNADFFDRNKKLSGKDSTFACGNDIIQPGARKSFEFYGSDPGDYRTVEVSIESFDEVK